MRQTPTIPPAEITRQLALCDQIHALLDQTPGQKLAFVDTYGCQQNEADSERLRGYLARMGYAFSDTEEGADLVLVNTCAIREHAEHRVFGNVGALSHTKRRHPGQVICVCGCMARQEHVAQRLRQSFPYVDLVFGPQLLWQFPQLLLEKLTTGKRVFATQDVPGAVAEGIPVVRQNPRKAWVSIMYGCNNFCTYCIVPYVRGRERSRQPEDILAEVRELAAAGYQDITLLGQNVNSYGKDRGDKDAFAALLRQVDAIPGVERVRYMTSHPRDMSEELIRTVAESKHVCKHFHIPVQSGSTRIMQAMNRGYTRESYLHLVDTIRKYVPEAVLTTDIIVGFPGETEEDFQETLSLFDRVSYDAAYTFIYSKRSGTPAAAMEAQVPEAVKKDRLNRLMELQNRHSLKHNQKLVGRTLPVMVEGLSHNNSKMWSGRTDGNKLVLWPVGERFFNPGDLVPVTIETAQTWLLKGRAAL